MGQRRGLRNIVDGHDVKRVMAKGRTQDVPTDSSKAVNADSNPHRFVLPGGIAPIHIQPHSRMLIGSFLSPASGVGTDQAEEVGKCDALPSLKPAKMGELSLYTV